MSGAKKNRGFTLIEILTSLVIVGIIIAGVMPGVVNTIKTIYMSAEKNKEILQSETDMQIGISKNVSYTGTTFPVKLPESDDPMNVRGSLIEADDYATFLAERAYIKINPFVLIEGYKPLKTGNNPDGIDVDGYKTNFTDGSTSLKIYDKNDSLVNGSKYNLKNIIEEPSGDTDSEATIEIYEGLRNAKSPYIIRIETAVDESLVEEEIEVVRAELPVNLPRFLAAGKTGKAVVSAEGNYWVNHNTLESDDLYGVIWGNNRYITVGESGRYNILSDGDDWQTGLISNKFRLNDGIYYQDDNNESEYEIVSSGGTISRSDDGFSWNTIPGVPHYSKEIEGLNNKPGIHFDTGIKSLNFPINTLGDSDRTIIIVIEPQSSSHLLLDMTDQFTYDGGERWTLLRDSNNNLRLEIDDSSYIDTDFKLVDDQPYVITSVLEGLTLADHKLYRNGEKISSGDAGFNVTNGSQSVKTDANKVYLGYQFRDNKQYTGNIAELIIYDKALAETDDAPEGPYLENIHYYLAEKYDIDMNYSSDPPAAGHEPTASDNNMLSLFKGETLNDKSDGEKVYSWTNDNGISDDDAFLADTGLNSLVYGSIGQNEIYIAVGDNGNIMRRENQGNWKLIEAVTSYNLNDVCWSSNLGKFYAVGEADPDKNIDAIILSSANGINWTQKNSEVERDLNGIISYYDEENDLTTLLAVGDSNDSYNAVILSSSDGTNWSEIASLSDRDLNDITYQVIEDQVYFVAAGDADIANNENAVILYSTDGQSWLECDSSIQNNLYGIGR